MRRSGTPSPSTSTPPSTRAPTDVSTPSLKCRSVLPSFPDTIQNSGKPKPFSPTTMSGVPSRSMSPAAPTMQPNVEWASPRELAHVGGSDEASESEVNTHTAMLMFDLLLEWLDQREFGNQC